MKIGVFDSGVGGRSVADAIERALPEHTVIFRNDVDHVPYGSRSMGEVFGFVVPILQSLVDDGVCCVVIACNTVSTNLIEQLRKVITVPLIAMEPMVKPATEQTKTGVITVCATPATLASKRYRQLKEQYAAGVTVLEPDCSDWAELIEADALDREKIADTVQKSLDAGTDVVVLGCTHYHWIENEIKALVEGKAKVIQPEGPVIARLKRVLLRQF